MARSAWISAGGRTEVRRAVLIVACAVSAGIHGALVRDHLAESVGLGIGFLISAVLLIVLATALTMRGGAQRTLASAALLAGLIVAYLFAVTTGLPFLHLEVEPVDGLALFTKSVEALGLLVALDLLGRASLGLHSYERTTT